jgi:ribosomal-protein-alanine N-acetyltransferase
VSPVSCRDAIEADLPAIVALDSDCFGNPWSSQVYRQELYRPFAQLRVAEVGGRLVGLCCAWRVGDEAHLLRIAILRETRRRGWGRHLLQAVLHGSAAAGCRQVLLEVAAHNQPAVRLYTAHGFEILRRRHGYYADPPDDALVMGCSVGTTGLPL